MSGQFDTESGGTVGIYRKKDRYQLLAGDGNRGVGVFLTEDELYRLIYMASKDLRWLVSRTEWIANCANPEMIDNILKHDMQCILDLIPTEAEITKRRRAAQRKRKG